jgi:hypothetical protein
VLITEKYFVDKIKKNDIGAAFGTCRRKNVYSGFWCRKLE